jgi:CRISPR-associated protein Cas1
MKRLYYIFSNGRLVRKQNTVYLHSYADDDEEPSAEVQSDAASQAACVLEDLASDFEDGDSLQPNEALPEASTPVDEKRAVIAKRPIPIEDVEAFFLFGEADLNTKLLNFLARHKVPLHVFNYFGFYSGSFYPRQEVNSGFLLVKQCEHYGDARKRLLLAQKLVEGASFNILKNLKYYGASSRGRDMSPFIDYIEAARSQIASTPDVPTCMGIEGTIRAKYYEAWPLILSAQWAIFQKRVKRPPDNPVNALISFGNSLCYTLALGEIYRTPLSPLISYLHEPGARRYSLSLDMAEIFKPILADRLIFKLINNGEIRPEHFDEKLNFCYLKESGRKKFLEQWDERLKQTIEHRSLGRKVSYRRLVRLECYKLEKHLMEAENYEPFKIWW